MKKIIFVVLALAPLLLIAQDSIPPLSSFDDADIDTVTGVYATKIVTLRLKSGQVYNYDFSKTAVIDAEKYRGKRFEVMGGISRQFTKTEYPPSYPGGAAAWDKYLQQFKTDHAIELSAAGHGTVTIMMMVDFNGQLFDIGVYQPGRNALSALARKAITDSGPWMPALQNHYRVTAHHKMEISF